jgi:hypothetical protein
MRCRPLTLFLPCVLVAMPASAQLPTCTLALTSATGFPGTGDHAYQFHGICTPKGGEPIWIDGTAEWDANELKARETLVVGAGYGGGQRQLTMKCLNSDPWLPLSATAGQAKYDFTGCAKVADNSSSAVFPKGSDPLPGFAGMDLATKGGGGAGSVATRSAGAAGTAEIGRTPPGRRLSTPPGTISMSDQKKLQTNTVVDSVVFVVPAMVDLTGIPGGLIQAPATAQLRAGESVALAGGMRLAPTVTRAGGLALMSRAGDVLKTFPAGAELKQARDGTTVVVAGREVFLIPQVRVR